MKLRNLLELIGFHARNARQYLWPCLQKNIASSKRLNRHSPFSTYNDKTDATHESFQKTAGGEWVPLAEQIASLSFGVWTR